MRRIVVLAVYLLTSIQLSMSKSKQINDSHDLVLMPSYGAGFRKTAHSSHGSASHYSSVQYIKKTNKNDIKKIAFDIDVISEMKEIIEKRFKTHSSYNRCECGGIQVIYTYLLSIDDITINKKCYSIKFLLEYYTDNDMHGHDYYHYYLTEDGSLYYRVEPFFLKGNMEKIDWLKQILHLIK